MEVSHNSYFAALGNKLVKARECWEVEDLIADSTQRLQVTVQSISASVTVPLSRLFWPRPLSNVSVRIYFLL